MWSTRAYVLYRRLKTDREPRALALRSLSVMSMVMGLAVWTGHGDFILGDVQGGFYEGIPHAYRGIAWVVFGVVGFAMSAGRDHHISVGYLSLLVMPFERWAAGMWVGVTWLWPGGSEGSPIGFLAAALWASIFWHVLTCTSIVNPFRSPERRRREGRE